MTYFTEHFYLSDLRAVWRTWAAAGKHEHFCLLIADAILYERVGEFAAVRCSDDRQARLFTYLFEREMATGSEVQR